MEISGKITQLLPEKTGESARGPWRKQEYILETEGQYPKQVCLMAWSDKIDEFARCCQTNANSSQIADPMWRFMQ